MRIPRYARHPIKMQFIECPWVWRSMNDAKSSGDVITPCTYCSKKSDDVRMLGRVKGHGLPPALLTEITPPHLKELPFVCEGDDCPVEVVTVSGPGHTNPTADRWDKIGHHGGKSNRGRLVRLRPETNARKTRGIVRALKASV